MWPGHGCGVGGKKMPWREAGGGDVPPVDGPPPIVADDWQHDDCKDKTSVDEEMLGP